MFKSLGHHPPRALDRGLTLMELMTVLVIISILAVLLLPLVGYLRQRSEITGCTQNIKGLHVAAANYVTAAGHWPQMDTKLIGKPSHAQAWYEALRPYGIGPKNWVCPSAQRMLNNPDVTNPKNARVDYHATPFDKEPQTPYKWPTQPWFAEAGDFHGDGPLLIFSAGQVKSLRQHLRDTGFKK
jgi:prepilin-type N-terminal cleavage/methylation domain-containing protein